MKKIEFYTLIRKGDNVNAVKVKGYTDNNYNYYKDEFNNWHAVIPNLLYLFTAFS